MQQFFTPYLNLRNGIFVLYLGHEVDGQDLYDLFTKGSFLAAAQHFESRKEASFGKMYMVLICPVLKMLSLVNL